jgi:hypothetical protein
MEGKESVAPPPKDNAAFLEELINPTPIATATVERKPAKPRVAKPRNTAYDRITRQIGLCVALVLTAGIWFAGAYFTLQWLSSMGLRLAGAGLLSYLIPLAITGLEIGLRPDRSPTWISRFFWFAVLLFDAGTTAAGVAAATDGKVVAGIAITGGTLWAIGSIAGLFFALFPEIAARSLLSELKK